MSACSSWVAARTTGPASGSCSNIANGAWPKCSPLGVEEVQPDVVGGRRGSRSCVHGPIR